MTRPIQILGVAPYDGMKVLMSELAGMYPQAELTLLVGDLEEGVALAKSNFYDRYDVVISRGGTAKMLRQQLSIPVVEIEASIYDVLCAVKLADALSGRSAVVSFSNIATAAQQLCQLLGCSIDIFTIDSPEEVAPVLMHLRTQDYQAILCDVIANTTAKQLGINSFLITSGAESIRQAFERALDLCKNQQRLRDESRFFRSVLKNQSGDTTVFADDGTLFFSTLEPPDQKIMTLLQRELPEARTEENRRVTRSADGMVYSIRSSRIVSGSLSLTAFFFSAKKPPIAPAQMGLRFVTCAQAQETFYNSIFSFAETAGALTGEIERLNQTDAPVMVSGEDGTGKEPIVSRLFSQSRLKNHPLVCLNCSLLNDKGWDFLLEHHNSPLCDSGTTLYFSSIDALPRQRRNQLIAALLEMDVCRRNRVIFSCVCRPGEFITEAGATITDRLCCVSLYLPPLRQSPDRIPQLVNLTLSHLNATLPRQIIGLQAQALELLKNYYWPHNYTQLARIIKALAVTAEQPTLTTEEVRTLLKKEQHIGAFSVRAENAAAPLDLARTLEEINRDVALRVLEESGGNQTAAAKRLGISRTTFWRLTKATQTT